jgi:hypothetical protein
MIRNTHIMRKKISILIFLSFVLLVIYTYFFYQNKYTLECVSALSLSHEKIVNNKSSASLSLLLNKNFSTNFKDLNVKKNTILIDISENNITLVSKLRFVNVDKQIAMEKVQASINQLVKFKDLNILQAEIDCKQESGVYNLILPMLLLLSLIGYAYFIFIKRIS